MSNALRAERLIAAKPFLPQYRHGFADNLIRALGTAAGPTENQDPWVERLIAIADEAKSPNGGPPLRTVEVGSMEKVVVLFDEARKHLERPRVVIAGLTEGPVQIKIAGEDQKVPGSIDVTIELAVKPTDENPRGTKRDWIGRILQNGKLELSPKYRRGEVTDKVTALLQEFSRDPATGAKKSARLTGRCCFCALPLKDERSTDVGYGKHCASRYKLPW